MVYALAFNFNIQDLMDECEKFLVENKFRILL